MKNAAGKKTGRSGIPYLEKIHVFGLANLLEKTIITMGPEKIGSIQDNDMRGIYFPSLVKLNHGMSTAPILINYDKNHFEGIRARENVENLYSLSIDLRWKILTKTTI